jgi:phosphate transport system protein
MSAMASDDPDPRDVPEPAPTQSLRHHYAAELEQVNLQAEVMAERVRSSVAGACRVLETGDRALAAQIVAGDDEIDAMLVSLTERCYEIIAREAPVASDLRLLVSVLRILEELERIGDLSLRVVKQVDAHDLLAGHPGVFATLREMGDVARSSYECAVDAWSARSLDRAIELVARARQMDGYYSTLLSQLVALDGPDAVGVAIAAVLVGRSLERIGDHAVVIGERLRYLLTGDSAYLASEIR